MIDRRAELIIHAAIAGCQSAPDRPLLEVLDDVMRQHIGCVIHFGAMGHAWTDWLNPPSPFAMLLQEAFAPRFPEHNLEFWSHSEPVLAGAVRDLWALEIIEPFARRYHLRLL